MTIVALPRETRPGERRVAMVPAEVSKLVGAGAKLVIEAGAGTPAGFDDDAYAELDGTTLARDRAEALSGAEVVVTVQPPQLAEVADLPQGCTWIGFLPPASNLEVVEALAARRVTAFSFDLIPRISRAQSMDALSSQASLAGYQAAVLAAERLGRIFPMMMTAAGTIPPAKVLVMGAGVAGLQAVATARRLGAAVSAYDVRPEAADEVRSLGATFLDLPLEAASGSGGYAAEQSADFLARQQELIGAAVGRSDVVITTAAVPGRRAPRLLTAAMVEAMKPGSVVVDLASASGGNCELTRDGEEFTHRGVLVIGSSDLPSRVATAASTLYARNVTNLMGLLMREGRLQPDFDDAVVSAACVTASGVVRHEPTLTALKRGNA